MLVLTRKQNEGIIIGDDIVVTVLNIEKDKIRLGIQAPRSIRVIREELLVEIREENRLAVQSEYNPIDLIMSQLANKTKVRITQIATVTSQIIPPLIMPVI